MAKVMLAENAKEKSYYKYYEMDIEALNPEQEKFVTGCKGKTEDAIEAKDRNKFIDSETITKTGFYNLNDGGLLVACNIDMPNVTPEMLEWWFAWHGLDPLRYTIWDPEDHFGLEINDLGRERAMDDSIPMNEKSWGAVHTVQESIGGPADEIVIMFKNPAEMGFDMTKYGTDACKFIVTANALLGPMKVPVIMAETAAIVNGNLEYRTRFWIGYHVIDGEAKYLLPPGLELPEQVAMGLVGHNIKEFVHLAKILPDLYEEEKGFW